MGARFETQTEKCWVELGWERGELIQAKGGNQSHTYLARHADDVGGEHGYILKKLKRQNSPDKRAMFHVETSAVKALDHPGVLPITATNSHLYQDHVELFLITPRANGLDLEDLVSSGLRFEDAIRVVRGVLGILNHGHSRGVVHRDIKPCHVFTSPDEMDAPVLIDFGLVPIPEPLRH